MTSLEALDAALNSLSGPLSARILQLADSLRSVFLSGNQMTGTLPDMRQLRNLNELYLDKNQFVGNIENIPWESSALVQLVVSDNQLTGNLNHNRCLIGFVMHALSHCIGSSSFPALFDTFYRFYSNIDWLFTNGRSHHVGTESV